MPNKYFPYRPDYAAPPGWALRERLDAHGISQAELARRCGRSPKLISEIISGKAGIDTKTALQLEKALGVDARIWLGMDADYRLLHEREAEARGAVEWANLFPIRELAKRGLIPKPTSDADKASAMLSFFGVASPDAWRSQHDAANIAYRHSPSFKSDEFALAAWLRIGEIEADRVECAEYSASRFKRALREIRGLTASPPSEAIDAAKRLCRESGVALIAVKAMPDTALSGASRWLSPRKAVIQLNDRHKRDDHLWFSLFHEAAHILLHSKRELFVNEDKLDDDPRESKADEWAANFLIENRIWQAFVSQGLFGEDAVADFAHNQGIAPGVVVGRLQHESLIHWNTGLNRLKAPIDLGM